MHKLFSSHDQNSYLIEVIIADVRLILKGNKLCHYIDMLVSLPILIALRHIIYRCKWINEHFPTQVQLCEYVQPFMRY